MKNIQNQLKSINKNEDTNQLIVNPHNFSELTKLVREINVTLVSRNLYFAHFRETEQELKEQITNISHDLRTPLASILGYFELINDGTTTAQEKEQYLSIIEKRARLLQNLIGNYYDLIQLEMEEQEIQMNAVNAKEVLIDVLTMFYYDFTETRIAVDMADACENFKVLADKELLQRVFINLVQNILKHGYERCEIVHERCEKQIYTIIRNKIIKSEQIEIEKVFNRLYSADKTRNTGNTGIGLTITKLLIEKMGHNIDAEITENGWFSIKITWQT